MLCVCLFQEEELWPFSTTHTSVAHDFYCNKWTASDGFLLDFFGKKSVSERRQLGMATGGDIIEEHT